MINDSYETFFGTLANENRLVIIHFLAKNGPNTVSDIAKGTKLEQSMVSHNLKRLLNCQFVHLQPDGKERIYSVNNDTIAPLLKIIDKHIVNFCKQQCQECLEPNTGGAKSKKKDRQTV